MHPHVSIKSIKLSATTERERERERESERERARRENGIDGVTSSAPCIRWGSVGATPSVCPLSLPLSKTTNQTLTVRTYTANCAVVKGPIGPIPAIENGIRIWKGM